MTAMIPAFRSGQSQPCIYAKPELLPSFCLSQAMKLRRAAGDTPAIPTLASHRDRDRHHAWIPPDGAMIGCDRVSGVERRPFMRGGPLWRCADQVRIILSSTELANGPRGQAARILSLRIKGRFGDRRPNWNGTGGAHRLAPMCAPAFDPRSDFRLPKAGVTAVFRRFRETSRNRKTERRFVCCRSLVALPMVEYLPPSSARRERQQHERRGQPFPHDLDWPSASHRQIDTIDTTLSREVVPGRKLRHRLCQCSRDSAGMLESMFVRHGRTRFGNTVGDPGLPLNPRQIRVR